MRPKSMAHLQHSLLGTEQMGEAPSSEVINQNHVRRRRVVWPPKLLHQTPLGYLNDSSGNYFPRDIGRSSVLSDGTVIFQFGDTFCHSLKRKYLGSAINTYSVSDVSGHSPTVSSYFSIRDQKNSEQQLLPFLPLLPSEGDTDTHQFKLWSFSGIVETHVHHDSGNHYGLCWYETRRIERGTNLETEYLYTGIAEVIWNRENNLLKANRQHPVEHFHATEPRFGAVCAVTHGQHIYLYGHTPDTRKGVVLARAPIHQALQRNSHEFWDGNNFTRHMNNLKPVFTTMQHGQVFQTEMFGRFSPWKWAFVGCSSLGDSKLTFGRAKAPQGPWETHVVDEFRAYAMQNCDPAPFRYCFYPHPWAVDVKSAGDLIISWSEGGMNGHVIAEKIRFDTAIDHYREVEDVKMALA